MKFETIKSLMEKHNELLEILEKENYEFEVQDNLLLMRKHFHPNNEVKIFFTKNIVKIELSEYKNGFFAAQVYKFSGKNNKNKVLNFLSEIS